MFLFLSNMLLLILLWWYNQWNSIFEFLYFYTLLFLCGIILVILVYIITFKFFQQKNIKKLINTSNSFFYLFSQSLCIVFLYLILITLFSINNEIYLSYIKNPMTSVKQYSTTDLTSFSPEFYYGKKKTDNHYKEFISKQNDVILSVYNVGYNFRENNYDPYAGNSLLVSPKFFDTQKILENNGKEFKFIEKEEKNTLILIIPINQKLNEQKIKKEYSHWMSFITDIPVEELDININYSKEGQNVYSYAYQNDMHSLKLTSPVIMVINPVALNAEHISAYMSNRFISFIPDQDFNETQYYQSYFAEISQIRTLIGNQLLTEVIKWISLILSIYFLTLVFVIQIKTIIQVDITDRLIWNVLTLTLIILILPFEMYAILGIIFFMFYLIAQQSYKKI